MHGKIAVVALVSLTMLVGGISPTYADESDEDMCKPGGARGAPGSVSTLTNDGAVCEYSDYENGPTGPQ